LTACRWKSKAGNLLRNIADCQAFSGCVFFTDLGRSFPRSEHAEHVQSGRYTKGKWFKRLNQTDHHEVENALKMVEMCRLIKHQQIRIARKHSRNADFLLLSAG
jgi:hypothetical protein